MTSPRPPTTPVLVIVEVEQGLLADASAEALTLARGLAEALDVPLDAVLVGSPGLDVADRLGAHGVATVHLLEHELLADYAPEAWAEAILQLMAVIEPEAVAAAGTERGNEVAAHVAARAGLPMAANCTAVSASAGQPWSLTRQRWGGILLEDAVLEAATKVFTVAPHAVRPVEAGAPADSSVEKFTPDLSEDLLRTAVREHASREEGVALATAGVVVSGGRGVGSAEGFAVLEELAGLLGGAVGCSRVATNNGWRSHSDQVGQTGTRVAPDLYVACGISGATQHWVGCMAAKRILAVNTDPEAPLVQRAHYAVLGNLHEVLPAVVAEIRRRRNGG